jgi:hypothetical protein
MREKKNPKVIERLWLLEAMFLKARLWRPFLEKRNEIVFKMKRSK